MPEQLSTLEKALSSGWENAALSDWFEVTQKQIDEFAEATGDRQGIHCQSRARPAGPFGGPIAHGLLLLSICLEFACESRTLTGDSQTWVVCGCDRVRFRAPVHAGKRIRCSMRPVSVRELGHGNRVVMTIRFKIEIENQKVPALVGTCSLVCLDDGPAP